MPLVPPDALRSAMYSDKFRGRPLYKLPHEVMPYELERSLPMAVVDRIYSYLRPKPATKNATRILRLEMDLNHKISAMNELLARRQKVREEKEERRKKLVASLENIINSLESSLK
jgi:hypothetical protein